MYISAASVNNIYYVVRRYTRHKQAMRIIEELTEITEIAGTTESEILHALMNTFRDFEDSIQYSAALTIKKVEAVITRNIKDYTKSEIAVFTADENLKSRNWEQ